MDLVIKLDGNITESNFDKYKENALAIIDGINTDLKTDEDFSQAEKAVKLCQAAEKSIDLAKHNALQKIEDISVLFQDMDIVMGKLRETRLSLSKDIKKEKQTRKTAIIKDAENRLKDLIAAQHVAVKQFDVTWQMFPDAAKGKRNLESIQKAVDEVFEALATEIDGMAGRVENNLAVFESLAAGHESLFADKNSLLVKPESELVAVIEGRLAKADLEAKEVAERKAIADAERIAKEEREELQRKAEAESTPESSPSPEKPPVEYPPLESEKAQIEQPAVIEEGVFLMTIKLIGGVDKVKSLAEKVNELVGEFKEVRSISLTRG